MELEANLEETDRLGEADTSKEAERDAGKSSPSKCLAWRGQEEEEKQKQGEGGMGRTEREGGAGTAEESEEQEEEQEEGDRIRTPTLAIN